MAVKNGRIRLDRVLGGKDPVLTDLVNQLINENFSSYTDITIPLVCREAARVFKRYANKFLVRFTEEQLFP